MNAKPTPATEARLVVPGIPTPSYPEGGFFTLKSPPVTINGTKDQVLDVLLRVEAYRSWSTFLCDADNIVHPENINGGENAHGEIDPSLVTVGSKFDVTFRLFPNFPSMTTKSTETVVSIEKSEEKYVITWKPSDVPAERVHIISDPEEGYGTCTYETVGIYYRVR
ncbi:hypothetical protein AA313_de0205587 [Arthrobotrys entomopaga]|nr:hypothetical protein AA313_de0205587 [Arthrobotrys entomopaga]